MYLHKDDKELLKYITIRDNSPGGKPRLLR